jgi:hypothetical protein
MEFGPRYQDVGRSGWIAEDLWSCVVLFVEVELGCVQVDHSVEGDESETDYTLVHASDEGFDRSKSMAMVEYPALHISDTACHR